MTLETVRILLSNLFLFVFLILIAFGLLGMLRFKTTAGRILNSSKIDSVAVIFLMTALMLRSTSLAMTMRLLAITVFFLVTNPVTTQLIAYSAKKNGAENALFEKESRP